MRKINSFAMSNLLSAQANEKHYLQDRFYPLKIVEIRKPNNDVVDKIYQCNNMYN